MVPRIAIPVPHSGDSAYAERALPQYERAVEMAGGEPVRIPLDQPSSEVTKIIESCAAVLLPGSRADVDPTHYEATRHPNTADADAKRDQVDKLLLDDAYRQRKPILGICYGLQILNVYRKGSLIQDIKEFLPPEKRLINHAIGRKMPVAHSVQVEPGSMLEKIVQDCSMEGTPLKRAFGRVGQSALNAGTSGGKENHLEFQVNSSHHQSANAVGENLRIAARCPGDGIIEALEGIDTDHFVLAVQWHPERTVEYDEPSRAIFRALVNAANIRRK
jgi:putative glutamine amidotransferase